MADTITGQGTGNTAMASVSPASQIHGGHVLVQWGTQSQMKFTIGKCFKHELTTLIFDAAVRLGLAGRDDDEDDETLGKKSVYVKVGDDYRLKKLHRIFADLEEVLNGEDRDIVEDGKITVVNDLPARETVQVQKKKRKQGTEAQGVCSSKTYGISAAQPSTTGSAASL